MPYENRPRDKTGIDVYLGLGSNLNHPTLQIKRAIRWLQRFPHTQVIQCAGWYRSKAWGVTTQDDFINTVVHAKTHLSPLALLRVLKMIEYRLMHRQPNARWHARCIDIDILLYGQQRHQTEQLRVPHPLLAQRCFVAVPLLELNPRIPIAWRRRLLALLDSGACEQGLCQLPQSWRRNGLKGSGLA